MVLAHTQQALGKHKLILAWIVKCVKTHSCEACPSTCAKIMVKLHMGMSFRVNAVLMPNYRNVAMGSPVLSPHHWCLCYPWWPSGGVHRWSRVEKHRAL